MGELPSGYRLDDYEIVEEVAHGGMGRIYKARELGLNRTVAIKVVSGPRADDEQFRKRFRREALHIASVDHPNVIPVYGAGETDAGDPYLVMRFVDGTDLAAWVAANGTLAPSVAVPIIEQVARALDAAHERSLVHRDVKPANVLLTGPRQAAHAYLTDFGLTKNVESQTKLTLSGEWLGTAGFAAPEQIEGDEVMEPADIYSLGCVLYFCLAGEQPFSGHPAKVMWSHVNHDLPSLPSSVFNATAFDALIARATAKDPGERWQRAGDLASAATRVVEGREIKSEELRPAPDDQPTKQMITKAADTRTAVTAVLPPRKKWPWIAGSIAAIGGAGVAVALAVGIFGGSSADRSKPVRSAATPPMPAPRMGDVSAGGGSASSAEKPTFVRTSLDPRSRATAMLPRGKRTLESFGELRHRTRIDTVDGAVLIVDYTPQDPPAPGSRYAMTGRSITNTHLGVRSPEYVTEHCDKGRVCIDYPLDLGGYGFAILGAAATSGEARRIARKAAQTLDAPANVLRAQDIVRDCDSRYAPNVSDLSVRNMDCSEADDLTVSVVAILQPGVFQSAGFTCQILGEYGPRSGRILGASDIRCTKGNTTFRFSWGD